MAEISLDAMVGDQLGMLERPDSFPMLDQINVPTLLIHGADDRLVPLEDMRILQAKIPTSELQIIPDAGHMVNMEQPLQFNRAVSKFLQRKG
jgi:pimeloyl-ACP methyl ester carboxylesterase